MYFAKGDKKCGNRTLKYREPTLETRNIFKKDIRRLSNTYNFNTTK